MLRPLPIFNVVEHAETDHATVELSSENGRLVDRVKDAGAGFDVEKTMEKGRRDDGFGLVNSGERLDFVGGRLEMQSRLGEGTCVGVYAPGERRGVEE